MGGVRVHGDRGDGAGGALTNNIVLTLVVGEFSSYFLQLVLLPVIIVGQNVQQAATDARAEADHATLVALYSLTKEIHGINVGQNTILTQQAQILEALERHLQDDESKTGATTG